MRTITTLSVILGNTLLLSSPAQALMTGQFEARLVLTASCQVSSAGGGSAGSLGTLDFGQQGPTWTAPVDARLTGTADSVLQVACNPSVTGFSVTIDGGTHGDGTTRRLSNGRQTIPYQLSFDVAGNQHYPIGQQRTFAVSSGGQVPIPIYGAVVPNPDALPVGVYSDILTVTLDW
ncbi:MAG: spore coat protein U domain-containing protein [Pseudomonas sp.]|uniref:Csu type fimbrial protein n=1 Tax=Pseudomonas abieticivorans TaxID=2931382 RepID=UPI0020BD9EAC|nr:spore coat U domain-containing protein [Pseudomonas sp. PIA16]MDE1168053.1 spore coat protein U domain-containing protein [Pseudomonas sp.]